MLPSLSNSHIFKSVLIHRAPELVWQLLTHPDLMPQWMAEPEMKLEVVTDWQIGEPFIIRGFHHIAFENKGTVLQFEPHARLGYDYLSSISRLPDTAENRTRIEFHLTPKGQSTEIKVTLSQFPTESIRNHVNFYWSGTLGVLKSMAEAHDFANPSS